MQFRSKIKFRLGRQRGLVAEGLKPEAAEAQIVPGFGCTTPAVVPGPARAGDGGVQRLGWIEPS